MRIIGLTGGIACGKSTVSSFLAECGVLMIDGDKLSRELTSENGAALIPIRECFGNRVFCCEKLDRHILGSIVFNDPSELKKLNSIMSPLLDDLIRKKLDAALADHIAVCVLDMPLLFESGLDRLCDSIWCVSVPEDIQISRLIQRDRLTASDAKARISSQWPTDKKCSLSDVVIDNNGPIDNTLKFVFEQLRYELSISGRCNK